VRILGEVVLRDQLLPQDQIVDGVEDFRVRRFEQWAKALQRVLLVLLRFLERRPFGDAGDARVDAAAWGIRFGQRREERRQAAERTSAGNGGRANSSCAQPV
jgi:hypothetical protein